MLAAAWTWIAGSRLGRAVGALALAAAAVGLAFLQGVSRGRLQERVRRDQIALDAVREIRRVEDRVARLPRDEKVERLKRWSRR